MTESTIDKLISGSGVTELPGDADELMGMGRTYWRNLDDYANSPEVAERIAREFPEYDPDELLSMSRRKFMKLAGASMALAGLTLTGCRRWPKEKIVAHNARPEGTLPGVPELYASMIPRNGVAYGVFVTTFDGRPIYIAGSPLDPVIGDPQRFAAGQIKRGAADSFTIAEILNLYDPDRSRSVVRYTGGQRGVSDLETALRSVPLDGGRVAVLSEADHGPTFADVKRRFLAAVPGATWTTWEPAHRDAEVEGSRLAFGQPMRAHYDFGKAKIVACFDGDPLSDHPAAAKHARGWGKLRLSCDAGEMSRVYALGPCLTPTSSSADVHLQVRPSTVAAMLDALAAALAVPGFRGNATLTDDAERAFIDHLVKDLKAHPGESLITVGPNQPAGVHALAWSINQHLGNLGEGRPALLTRVPDEEAKPKVDAIAELTDRLNAGGVDTLLILGGNPVFDAPADLGFAGALAKVPTRLHLSHYENETSVACDWHVPRAHALECWGDGRTWDGTVLLQQPLIQPLFGGVSPIELLARMTRDEATQGYDLVRRAWSEPLGNGAYDVASSSWAGGPIDTSREDRWRAAVHDAVLASTAYPKTAPTPRGAEPTGVSVSRNEDRFEVAFRADAKAYDGRYANNGWLQEVPDPITKITWDNPAWVSVADAKKLKLKNGDVIEIEIDGRTVKAAAFLTPGQAPGVIVLSYGQGRRVGGRIAVGVGFDTYAIRGTKTQGLAFDAAVRKTGLSHPIATTSIHHLIDTDRLKPNLIGDQRGTDATAQYALDKRVGKLPGDEGKIVKQASLEQYKKDLKKSGQRSFANDDAHGDLSLQLYDAPLAEEHAERALSLKRRAEQMVAEGKLDADLVEGWRPRDQFNDKHAWGMTIDLTACIGCTACIIACQSENNIPIVGKDQVMMSREMHWHRVDTYFRGKPTATRNFKLDKDDKDLVDAVHMPVSCVHCENAPCEQVCPVAATVHDTEGLNTMVYNRCIGTRYCSNNCPYKVRRFNYFDYHAKLDSDYFRNTGKDGGIQNNPWLKMPDQEQLDAIDQVRRMVFNPDVTVRMRGVMEKCTYCTQRITRAKIEAKARWAEAKTAADKLAEGPDKDAALAAIDDYPYVTDDMLVTACEGACPTEAVAFGNLNDPTSKVAQIQSKNKRAYQLLEELNARPRTQHLGLVRNPVKV
ncbi:MAG: TAT-variant-translocated molybdopterin oxidoreductase [Planctomycetota bacterium]